MKELFHKLNDRQLVKGIWLDDKSLRGDVCYIVRITKSDVKSTLRKIRIGKSLGIDDILIEVWKYLGERKFFS